MRVIWIAFLYFLAAGVCLSQEMDAGRARAEARLGGLQVCDPFFSDDESLGLMELNNSVWARHKEVPNAKTYYVIGAPWCPYCRSIYKMAVRESTDIEFRFILQDPRNALDVVKMADLAINGASALERIFGSRTYQKPNSIAEWDIEFFGDAALFNSQVLYLAWEPYIREIYRANNISKYSWASPISLEVVAADGFVFPVAYVGMPSINASGRVNRRAHGIPMKDRPISKSPPRLNTSKLRDISAGGGMLLRLHSLPEFGSPSLCADETRSFKVEGVVRSQGVDWLRVEALVIERFDKVGKPITVSAYVPLN